MQARILYEYLAEASVVFPKVFPVIIPLLDGKINSVVSMGYDQIILSAVQCIIKNMVVFCEEQYQNQMHLYLQSENLFENCLSQTMLTRVVRWRNSAKFEARNILPETPRRTYSRNSPNDHKLIFPPGIGFGGLWRFAGPFETTKPTPANSQTQPASFDSVDLFVNALEAMVDTCITGEFD